jgi:hypothetical protein
MHLRTSLCFYNEDTERKRSRQALDAKRYVSRRWFDLPMKNLFSTPAPCAALDFRSHWDDPLVSKIPDIASQPAHSLL